MRMTLLSAIITRKLISPFAPQFQLVSTIVATCSIFVGLYYGYVIQRFQFHSQRVVQWVAPSLIQLGLAFLIHFTFMPFNKNLYTISYIFLMGGTAGLIFTVCYILLDVAKLQLPAWPFVWLGSNSIILYVGDDILPKIVGPSDFVMIYYGCACRRSLDLRCL